MQAEGDDKKKYSWSYKDGKMTCCTSETSSCNVSKLWEVSGVTEFHDAELQEGTREINAILDGVRKSNRDPSRDLHFVQIEGQHLLAWVHSDLVGPHSDDQALSKMLRLKRDSSRRTPHRKPARSRRRGGAA